MKTQGCLLYPRPKYVKTEEIAERKGVIFLHLKERMCVCVWTTQGGQVRKSESACMREKHMEGKWEREGRKRNRPLIRWSQLITFSRPDGRHSSNLWPQPSGPSVFTLQQSPIRGKQHWVYAGRRNRWAWGVRLVTETLLEVNRQTPWGFRLPGFLTFCLSHFLTDMKKEEKKDPSRFLFVWMAVKTQHLCHEELNIGSVCCSKYSLGMRSAWVDQSEAVIPTGSEALHISRLACETGGSAFSLSRWHWEEMTWQKLVGFIVHPSCVCVLW